MLALDDDPPFGTFTLSLVRQEEPVRARILIAAAVVTGGWLAACSKPASPGGSGSDRQIQLAEPPSSEGAVVSDLESNHAVKPTLVPVTGHARTEPRAQAHRTAVAVEMAVAPAQPHIMSTTASSIAEAPPIASLSPAPEAAATGFGGAIGHGLGTFEAPAPGTQSLSGGSRGPMILIRGGMGGIDDKCDLRGGHRGGIAINRSSPMFGSYPRGGIR